MDYLNVIDKDITLLLDNLPVCIIRFNSEKQCIYANRLATCLFQLELSNMKSIYINSVHPEDIKKELEICNDFLLNYKECESTVRIFNKQFNDYRWMINKRTCIYSENSISYMYTLQDIHENKLLEIKLRSESLKAEKAYNHKSIFLANMSHEIRTPLNGIIGMLTLLEDTKLNTDQQDYIYMIKECSFNLMTIINDILDYSKLEVGKITLDIKSMNLRECIESTNDIILSKIYEKALEYNYKIDNEISEFIHGDQNRIKQILLNLISNSIKFTEKGNIFVNIFKISYDEFISLNNKHNKESDSTKEMTNLIKETNSTKESNLIKEKIYIRFDVTDTGCGINNIEVAKLFKSFSQVDNHITSKIYQGTGLGLAICKELVELMNGFIWLDYSKISSGSRFSFVIETEPSYNNNIHKSTLSENVLYNANVLIVDDNVHNRISLTGMISKWGMKAYAFSNAEEALYFTKITQFDIGLIDICMPKLDGPTFAQKLREQPEFNNKKIPLVALSSLGDKTASNSKYFKTHLIKPIKESKLKNVCIDLLQNRSQLDKIQPNDTDNSSTSASFINLDKYITQNNISELKENIRILLAEDVYINQKVVSSFLNKLGFSNIQIVENGQQCLDLAKFNNFDIILLDIRMPIMNGETVLKELLEYYTINNLQKPYIVAVTAYCLREDKDKYLNMGFDDYIPKPITISDLKRCLNTFIENMLQN